MSRANLLVSASVVLVHSGHQRGHCHRAMTNVNGDYRENCH